MTITTRDDFFNAMANNSSRLIIDKASLSNVAATQFHSLWRATGQPGQGATPTTAATCDNTLTGALQFEQQTSPATSYFGILEAMCSNASTTLEIHDRLMHMGGLNGTLTSAQTVGLDVHASIASDNLTARIGDSNYSDVQWWMEWYTDTGASAVVATVNVTYNDGTSGNLSNVTLTATRRASLMIPLNSLIPAANSGNFIRDINTVTLSASTGAATGTASATGAALTTSRSVSGGAATGTATATGSALTITGSISGGAGAGSASATGASLSQTLSVSGGAATGSASAIGSALSITHSLSGGAASSAVNGNAGGASLSTGLTLVGGSATGAGSAPGATLAVVYTIRGGKARGPIPPEAFGKTSRNWQPFAQSFAA